jgi:ABC-2 type transport system ATP-binding protein
MINIENLYFSYGNNNLFQELNLEIKKGKIYGLLGKNGAGKTTLLKIISGLIFPKTGNCSVFDLESRLRVPGMLKDIFFIPETYFLPEITIEEYEKLYSPFYEKFDKPYFFEKIKELELEKGKKISTFSYGQKKKLLLAFGIASKCKILIFDEPTNGLDIPSQRMIRKQLAESIDDERIFIISTHHVKEMENIFDTLIVLDGGKIIFKEDLDLISQKLALKIVTSLEGLQGIVYSEEIPGGYSVLLKNSGFEEGKMDIEFLFNAVLNENHRINNIFKELNF